MTLPSPPFMQLKPHFEATTLNLLDVLTRNIVFLTEDLVTNVVFPDKLAKKALVDSRLIDNLTVSARFHIIVTELTAVSQKVQPSSIALSKTGSASSRLRLDPRPKLMPMAPKPGEGTSISRKGTVLTMVNCDVLLCVYTERAGLHVFIHLLSVLFPQSLS